MKKALYFIIIGLLSFPLLKAQNLDDAIRFNKRELSGTSRSLGMANAFGALGGDLSSLSINPAGIATYRTSEFAFTPSITLNQSTATYGTLSNKDDKYAFPLNQIGFVTTNKPMRERNKGLISTHFGFTYNRTADFHEYTSMLLGRNITDEYDNDGYPTRINTLLTSLLWKGMGQTPDEMQINSYPSYQAYDVYLINPVFEDQEYPTEYFSEYEFKDESDNTIYNKNLNGITQMNIIERSGYAGEYGITIGANISHVLLLGGSINIQSFKYEQKESFREINSNGFDPAFNTDLDYYDAYNKLNQKGLGLNAKFGMILNLNPVRLGASFHTPTFFGIDEEYYSGMDSYFMNYDHYNTKSTITEFSYNYRTPYRANGSAAIILGKFALLSFDYEMTDHTSSKFDSKDGYATLFEDINKSINEEMKITHDFRAGIEIKPVPYVALRAGAAYFDSPIKDEYIDVELTKWMGTAGLGIRNKNFFFDVAYALKLNDDNYYMNTSEGSLLEGLSFTGPIKLENRNHQASFTFGWKF